MSPCNQFVRTRRAFEYAREAGLKAATAIGRGDGFEDEREDEEWPTSLVIAGRSFLPPLPATISDRWSPAVLPPLDVMAALSLLLSDTSRSSFDIRFSLTSPSGAIKDN